MPERTSVESYLNWRGRKILLDRRQVLHRFALSTLSEVQTSAARLDASLGRLVDLALQVRNERCNLPSGTDECFAQSSGEVERIIVRMESLKRLMDSLVAQIADTQNESQERNRSR